MNLSEFTNYHQTRKKIVIQGLGFVGSVMAIVCANSKSEDYAVIGVEQDNHHGNKIIKKLNNGIFPLEADDPKIELFFQQTIREKNFFATNDVNAYKFADIIIVDINLDVEKENNFDGTLANFNVNLSSFKNAINTIGLNCKEDCTILVETTVPPGTCENIVKPIIFKSFVKRNLPINKIKIGHSYERVMPGPNYIDSIQNFYRVYSGIDKKSADAVEEFLKTIISTKKYPLTRLENTNSTELAKVLENSYRAMNIAFMVEWTRFAEESNVNIYDTINAIRLRPTHSNMMYPGIGVGGYCLTKDALLASWSRQNLFKGNILAQSELAININDQMPRNAFEFLSKKINIKEIKNILLLGISYRGDVGDTRFSPVEKFYDYVKNNKNKIYVSDPYIKFWDEKSIDVFQNIKKPFEKNLDLIVIASGHSIYQKDDTINFLSKQTSLTIFDSIGLLNKNQIEILKKKHKVFVLGRGDL